MSLWRRRDESLSAEIQDYLDRQTAENVAAGMSPSEARAAARRKLGNAGLIKEDTRAAWGWLWLERLWQDVSHGARMFAKNPGFTFVAVLSIALGTGANCGMFSAVDAILLRPLPVERPNEIVTVGARLSLEEEDPRFNISYREYSDILERSQSFAGLAAFRYLSAAFVADAESPGVAPPKVKYGLLVTGNLFDVMGVRPVLGRAFRPEEDQVRSRDAVALISHNLWEQEFASDPSVVGRSVRINRVVFTVIGVLPRAFTGLSQFARMDFYIPTMMWQAVSPAPGESPYEDRNFRGTTVKGRLKPGVLLGQAQTDVAGIAASLAKTYPDTNRNVEFGVRTEFQQRLSESPLIPVFSAMATILAVAVLLVACTNLSGLLLSRAPVRAREVALRLAIGAPRGRLLRQLLTENLLLAVAGGLLGVLLGDILIALLRQIQFSTELPIQIDFRLDGRVLAYSMGIAVFSVFLFGFLPALETMKASLTTSIQQGGNAVSDSRRLWGRNALVTIQVAVALVLLTIAVSVYGEFRNEFARGPGYRTSNLLLMTLDHLPERTIQFYDQIVEEARLVGGVKSVALTTVVPMSMFNLDGVTLLPEGYRSPRGSEDLNTPRLHLGARVTEDYFDTLGIPVFRGRGFRKSDDKDAPLVAVVNQAMAERYWPGQDPVGKRFRRDTGDGPWVEIVGVVRTTKYLMPLEPPTEYVYTPLRQSQALSKTSLVAESFGDPAALATPLRAAISRLDRDQPVYDVMTMQKFYETSAVGFGLLQVQIVAGMGLIGLLLSVAGLYGLVSYSANRRTREIGIRMAVGAGRADVLLMILRQGLWLTCAGVVVGLLGSRAIDQMMVSNFPGMETTQAGVYLVVIPVLLLATVLAAFVPARRASLVNPTVALRHD